MTVSLIVPAYNVQEYLPACLDSILLQDLSLIDKVIVVNDGSTDGTLNIINQYAEDHPGIFTVVDQGNQGLSAARNVAMKLCNSRYLCFVDSDDYLTPTAVADLYEAAEKNGSDIVSARWYFVDGTSTKSSRKIKEGMFFGKDIYSIYLEHKGVDATAWGKLYKSELFAGHEFPVGLAYEDFFLIPEIFSSSNSLTLLNKEVYYYRVRDGSISRTLSSATFDILKGLDVAYRLISCQRQNDLCQFLSFLTLRDLLKKKKTIGHKALDFRVEFEDVDKRMNSLKLPRLLLSRWLGLSDKKKVAKFLLFGV